MDGMCALVDGCPAPSEARGLKRWTARADGHAPATMQGEHHFGGWSGTHAIDKNCRIWISYRTRGRGRERETGPQPAS